MSDALTAKQLHQLRRDVAGFNGRFEFRAEDEHCPDRIVYVSAHPDYEGDEQVISDCIDDNVADPLARMLNAIGPLLSEFDRVMRERDACVRALNEQSNARALAASRDDRKLTDLEAHLLDEADYNRSWVDGRRGGDRDPSEMYKARRIELAEQREQWAAQLRSLRAALPEVTP